MDATAYGPTVAALLEGVPVAPLDAGQPNEKYRSALEALTVEKLFAPTGRKIRDGEMAQCCLAGLWLRHNFFDESHNISQGIDTSSGSFWHAILHRREPDYGNARYWFRQVGNHPIFPALNEAALAAGWPATPRWDSGAFISRVEHALKNSQNKSEMQLCLAIQQAEWALLFDYCWQHAVV